MINADLDALLSVNPLESIDAPVHQFKLHKKIPIKIHQFKLEISFLHWIGLNPPHLPV
jgi:hypothetical protein